MEKMVQVRRLEKERVRDGERERTRAYYGRSHIGAI